MPGFRMSVAIPVRFRDTDAMGHVNNAVYMTYLEVAREAYWRDVMGVRDYRDCGLILARTEIDFRAPAFVGQTLEVMLRVSRIGRSSFDFAYEIRDRDTGILVAEARFTQVMYDYGRSEKRPLSEDERKAIRDFEEEVAG